MNINAVWELDKRLSYSDRGVKKITAFNKDMSSLEIEIIADFELTGWKAEGHFITPSARISRDFVPLIVDIVENKAVFMLEDKISSMPGEWIVDLYLKGPGGQRLGAKEKLKYQVIETADILSYDPILNAEKASTVDEAMKGLEAEIVNANDTKESLNISIAAAAEKDTELKQTSTTAQDLDNTLKGTTQAAETTKSELETENTTGQGTLQAIKDEGVTQKTRVVTEGNSQDARIIAEGDIQEARLTVHTDEQIGRIDGPVGDLALRMTDVETENAEQTTKIQNCVQNLSEKLLFVFSEKGISDNFEGYNIENISSNVVAGTNFALVKDGKSFYVGEAYKNIFNVENIGLANRCSYKYINDIFEVTKTENGVVSFGLTTAEFEESSTYNLEFQFLEGHKNDVTVASHADLTGTSKQYYNSIGNYEIQTLSTLGDYNYGIYIRLGDSIAIGEKIRIKIAVTDTNVKKPFVQLEAKEGKMITFSSYNETDNTVISLDENGLEQEYYIDSNGKVNFHLANDGVTKIDFVSFAGVFEKLTTAEKTEVLTRIANESYSLEESMSGAPFQLEGIRKRYANNLEAFSKFTYKKWAIIGDSISSNGGGHSYITHYWELISRKTKCACTSYAIGGTGFQDANGFDTFPQRVDTMNDDYDIITVLGGVNDHAFTLGNLGDTDETTFYGSVYATCQKLQTKFPTSTIVFITPAPRRHTVTYAEEVLDRRNAIIEVCKGFEIPIVDLYSNSSINPQFSGHDIYYHLNDGLHFNTEGHKKFTNYIHRELEKYLEY